MVIAKPISDLGVCLFLERAASPLQLKQALQRCCAKSSLQLMTAVRTNIYIFPPCCLAVQLNKQLPAQITIQNPSTTARMGFKVKTTTPKKYVVRPSSGICEPGDRVTVQVIMQAQKEFPSDLKNCKDKFLVQTVLLQPGEVRTLPSWAASYCLVTRITLNSYTRMRFLVSNDLKGWQPGTWQSTGTRVNAFGASQPTGACICLHRGSGAPRHRRNRGSGTLGTSRHISIFVMPQRHPF